MCESILVKLLEAYKEEGYAVSVGLNPFRESRHGAFCILTKIHLLESLPKFPDEYFASIYPVGHSPSSQTDTPNEVQNERNQIFFWQRAKNILKKFALVRIVYEKIKVSYEKELPVSASESASNSNPLFLSTGGGISIEEIYFFETILFAFKPKREFLIGIASGWSTIAFGLITPAVELYGIDNCTEGVDASEGLALTEKIAKNNNINLKIHRGSSPKDIPCFLEDVKDTIDFAFIDGLHTNEQVFQDFIGTLPYMSGSSIIAFHDVLNWNMIDGWRKISDVAIKNNYKAVILRRTTSGIGILYRNININVEKCIEAFYQNPSLLCPT